MQKPEADYDTEITAKLIAVAEQCKAVLSGANIGPQEQLIVTLIIASEHSHWFGPTCGQLMCDRCQKEFSAKDMRFVPFSDGEFDMLFSLCETCYNTPCRRIAYVDTTNTVHEKAICDEEFLKLLDDMKEVDDPHI